MVDRSNAVAAAADRGAGAGGHGEIGARAGIECVDAATTGAGGIAVGGDGERACAVVARRNAPGGAADRGAGGGGHGEIGAGVIPRVDADITGAGDIAVGGDGERAAAVVVRADAVGAATDRGAGAGGHAESGAGVPREDAVTTGAGDIAVGGDGERACAVVARKNAEGAAAERAIGVDGDAAGRACADIVADGTDSKSVARRSRERRGVGVGVGQGAVAGNRDRIAGGGVDAEPGDGGDAGVVGGDRLRGGIGA